MAPVTVPSYLDAIERITFASVALTTRVLDEVAGADLTMLGWRVLVIVGHASGDLRLGELADRLGISRPSATKAVQRLQRRGLVETARDHADARGRRLRLTPDGIQLRETVLARRRRLLVDTIGSEVPGDFEAGIRLVADRLDRWT